MSWVGIGGGGGGASAASLFLVPFLNVRHFVDKRTFLACKRFWRSSRTVD